MCVCVGGGGGEFRLYFLFPITNSLDSSWMVWTCCSDKIKIKLQLKQYPPNAAGAMLKFCWDKIYKKLHLISMHFQLLFQVHTNIILYMNQNTNKYYTSITWAIPCQINQIWHFLGRPISDFAQILYANSHQ